MNKTVGFINKHLYSKFSPNSLNNTKYFVKRYFNKIYEILKIRLIVVLYLKILI